MGTETFLESMRTKKGIKVNKSLNLPNKALKVFFMDIVPAILRNPLQAYFFSRAYKAVRFQHSATQIRLNWEKQGIRVPPIMVFSITNRCDRQCIGCYSQAQHRLPGKEMSDAKVRGIFQEAQELGISFIVFSGGEPFARREILDITKDFPEFIYVFFTNGLLIDDVLLKKLQKQKNVLPLISLEGTKEHTDERRGEGVFKHLQQTMTRMKNQGIFFGASLTLTSSDFETIVNFPYIESLFDIGCRFFIFFEYMAFEEGTEDWQLTEVQRAQIMSSINSFGSKFPAIFVAIPGDEGELGGCIAAGRGLVHVSADGYVEPCPFSPYSDANLNDLSLKDALQSKFLKAIRESQMLRETECGCPLWVKRSSLKTLLQESKK